MGQGTSQLTSSELSIPADLLGHHWDIAVWGLKICLGLEGDKGDKTTLFPQTLTLGARLGEGAVRGSCAEGSWVSKSCRGFSPWFFLLCVLAFCSTIHNGFVITGR